MKDGLGTLAAREPSTKADPQAENDPVHVLLGQMPTRPRAAAQRHIMRERVSTKPLQASAIGQLATGRRSGRSRVRPLKAPGVGSAAARAGAGRGWLDGA